MSDTQHTDQEQLIADALAPLMCPRHDCESTRHALNQLRVENKHLREDIARYENGRAVMTAEIEALREKLREAQQLAMRQANEIRKLQSANDSLHVALSEYT